MARSPGNLAAIDRFAAEAVRDGAALVAFPEYATYEKKKVHATFPQVAELPDGPICVELAATARRHRTTPVAGVVETWDEPGRSNNTLVALGPDGGRLAFYRKIHLFDAQGFGESEFNKPVPSTAPVVLEHSGVRAHDLLRPAVPRAGQVTGRPPRAGPVGLLVLDAGYLQDGAVVQLNEARAIENSVYVAGVCQAPPVSVGRCVLVDPMGVVEADLGLEPGVSVVEISLDTVDRVRESLPMFRQWRL